MINTLAFTQAQHLLGTSLISFPNLGIGEFSLDGVAFTIFGHQVMWYGVIMAIAVIVSFTCFVLRTKSDRLKPDNCFDITLAAIPAAIIGGRLYFVIFHGGYSTFKEIIAVWDGGIAFYGVFIGGLIAVTTVILIKKLNVFNMLDLIFSSLIIGQSIGRWGNFTNGECYGGLVPENFLFAMGLQNSSTVSTFGTLDTVFVHPYFLYESLWTLTGFILISVFYKKKAYHGEAALWYLAWYGLGRGILENLRMDSLYIGNSDIRVSSLLGLIGAGICIPLLIVMRVLYAKKKKAGLFEENVKPDFALVLGFKKVKTENTELSEELSDISTYPLPEVKQETTEESKEEENGSDS